MKIPAQEYKDFSFRIHGKGLSKPLAGQFELTYRCNLRCQHCYVVNDIKKKELTYKQFFRIFDEVYQEGCLWLCLTGGEPLLRKDFLDIYSYAYKKGFIITIFTNATLLNKETAEYLGKFPPFCIEVTLNGATQKTYELITQTPGSFEKAKRGIELIRRHKLPLKLKCQMMTLNFDELPLMRKFYQKLGMKFSCGILIDPRIDGSTQPCSLRLPISQVARLEEREEIAEGRDEFEDNFKKKFQAEQEGGISSPPDNIFRCPGGMWSFYVSPFGELLFCNLVRKPSWDLLKHSFKQGFYELFPSIRSAKFKTDSKCRSCYLWYFCFSCPGRAQFECGDPEAPIEYCCQLALLEAKHRQEKSAILAKK